MTTGEPGIDNHAAFIWSVADLLRGDYRQSEYGRVILPFTVLRRLGCVLDPVKIRTTEAVWPDAAGLASRCSGARRIGSS